MDQYWIIGCFIFRVRKNSAIFCLKSRDYSSSVPARYIPKRVSEVNKSETSPQRKRSDKKEFRELSDGFAMKSEVKHRRSGVQNYRDFDKKLPSSNSLPNDVEQGRLFFRFHLAIVFLCLVIFQALFW